MRNKLIHLFELPKQTVINRHVPKTTFFQNASLTKKEQDLFTSQIDGIYLLSMMNEQSMNVPGYESEDRVYEVINWIYVKLRQKQHTNRIIQAIHQSIPNPLVIIAGLGNEELLLSTAHKRLNKVDETKAVIEEPIVTNWFKLDPLEETYENLLRALQSQNLSIENIFRLYQDIYDWIQCEKAIDLADIFPNEQQMRTKVIHHISEIEKYRRQIKQLNTNEKDNLNFGDKMKLHMKRKKIEQLVANQIDNIKGLC